MQEESHPCCLVEVLHLGGLAWVRTCTCPAQGTLAAAPPTARGVGAGPTAQVCGVVGARCSKAGPHICCLVPLPVDGREVLAQRAGRQEGEPASAHLLAEDGVGL